jgi:hypothetical protein
MDVANVLYLTYALILASLATWQTVAVWRKGEIFAGLRAAVEVHQDDDNWLSSFVAHLLGCPKCTAVWVAGFWSLWLLGWSWPLLPTAAAASRLAGLCHDLTRPQGIPNDPN